ncbi:MAG: M55 family metallopeptidase [Armatimonadota bacterium]
MIIYISVDMEGISGISGSEFVMTDQRLYAEGRRYYTQDINACAQGCFAAGAAGVIARDGHGGGNHALWDQLDPRLELVQGDTAHPFPGLEEADALILLGYHALAGTAGALLEHTFSSATVQNLWLSGRLVGEIGIHAATAAELGVPVIMVSGDDKACAEAEEWIPGVITCQVKTGLTTQGARLLSAEIAHRLIAEKTQEAVSKLKHIPPITVPHPVTLRMEMKERIPTPREGTRPGMRVIDGRTVEATGESVTEVFPRLR